VKSMTMADPTAAERATGYVVGGISPLGQRKRHATYLDTTAAGFDTIYVSAGRRGLEIELAAADLLALTNGTLAPIGRTG
jgi:Cys-tRNA(Pro)/Cys-tRNA(Cys) deacylase